jgi:trehalose 6-phosphate synthase
MQGLLDSERDTFRSDLVVVANRLPMDADLGRDGVVRWKRSPGGLVSALEPFLRANAGTWVGWPGAADVTVPPFRDGDLRLHPVTLTAAEFRDYYEGFSNGTLWPLYHDVVMPAVFDRGWWDCYVRVNHAFAEAAAAVSAPGATVWVQDYQLQLVPAMLRELRPDLHIGFFLHIPFPPAELFMQLPWRTELINGLLGADLVGFHLPGGAQNFRRLAHRLGSVNQAHGRPEPDTLQIGARTVRTGAFPISIDAGSFDELARRPSVQARARQIRADLGGPRTIMLGVDRLDYTKGIDVRLRALYGMLETRQIHAGDTVMIQIATPGRERVEHYQRLRADVEYEVGRINGKFGRVGHPAVHYLHASVDREELAALYCAADIMLVTPYRDGMNLVCKEYVTCRHDFGGALVLSEFAGAAAELTSAFLVNPYHVDTVRTAIAGALAMDPADGRRRMREMHEQVRAHDVDRWAHTFLDTLSAHRRADELAGLR